MTVQVLQQFPRGFLWGCATAAHQVEGNNRNDWWRWEETSKHIFGGHKSGIACDWWGGRYAEDFDRAADMHNNSQRISIEWSRIEPEPDKWDEWAIARYRDMLIALRDRSMTPMVTLHHFSSPLWFADRGGWAWEGAPERFERYVRKVIPALADLCSLWCTINEPMVYVSMGYLFGKWTPGHRNRALATRAATNLLRGHAAAYHAIKELQPSAQVGYASHHVTFRPHAPALLHGLAVRGADALMNSGFVRAIRDGVLRVPGTRGIRVPQAKGTIDWIGLQYYQEFAIGFHPSAGLNQLFVRQTKPKHAPPGPADWGGIVPENVFDHIRWLYTTLKVPIYITESGVPDPDDTLRPSWIAETLRAVWRAVNFNYPVKGFFFWSLVDNFEWAEGYDPRFNFGLYKVNFETQERTARESAKFYGEVCAKNGLSSEMVAKYAPALLSKLYPGEAGKSDVKLKAPQPLKE
jgi:beta-glucosidase